MHGLSFSLPPHRHLPHLESFLLGTHAEVRRAGAVGAPGRSPGEAGVKPKAADQMWAHPAAEQTYSAETAQCLTKSEGFKNQKIHFKILDFWLLFTK